MGPRSDSACTCRLAGGSGGSTRSSCRRRTRRVAGTAAAADYRASVRARRLAVLAASLLGRPRQPRCSHRRGCRKGIILPRQAVLARGIQIAGQRGRQAQHRRQPAGPAGRNGGGVLGLRRVDTVNCLVGGWLQGKELFDLLLWAPYLYPEQRTISCIPGLDKMVEVIADSGPRGYYHKIVDLLRVPVCLGLENLVCHVRQLQLPRVVLALDMAAYDVVWRHCAVELHVMPVLRARALPAQAIEDDLLIVCRQGEESFQQLDKGHLKHRTTLLGPNWHARIRRQFGDGRGHGIRLGHDRRNGSRVVRLKRTARGEGQPKTAPPRAPVGRVTRTPGQAVQVRLKPSSPARIQGHSLAQEFDRLIEGTLRQCAPGLGLGL